jgi:nucleoside-diphosphate-sugar epimerase
MARVVVIGGSGHVGTYLVPQLVEAGHSVVNVSRGKAAPYLPNPAWEKVETVVADRTVEDASGTFAGRIAALDPDIVVDMIAFKLSSTQPLVEALRGKVGHFLHCGTIWVYGHNAAVPATESDPLNPVGEYGPGKAEIEAWLLKQARENKLPATVFRPGHIVGPGWHLINPAGNVSLELFARIRRGEEVTLPNFGLETVHHIHAEDIATQVMAAIAHRDAAVGEAFNTVSAQALNLRGFTEAMFRWFGHEPKIRYLPFEDWKKGQTADDAQATWEHISRSPSHSVDKARRLLGWEPRHSSLDAAKEAVTWLIDHGKIA